jgi:UDPglucose 6-dehydrogenase
MGEFEKIEMENNNKFKIAIVGHGFVGKAVDAGFENSNVQKILIDPKYGNTLDDMVFWDPDLVFVCVPTPSSDDGSVDASMVKEAVRVTLMETKAAVAIKSTVPPDIISQLVIDCKESNSFERVVYNPEFLRESSSIQDFLNPEFHLLGGISQATRALEGIYNNYSTCSYAPFIHVTIPEASFIKYGINSFLATKVTFFNQLYDAVKEFGSGANYNTIVRSMGRDSRIGPSHMAVPGYDGKRGFGGACFPKDTKALVKTFENKLTLLEKCIKINNEYRSQYNLDKRESEQNITYED